MARVRLDCNLVGDEARGADVEVQSRYLRAVLEPDKPDVASCPLPQFGVKLEHYLAVVVDVERRVDQHGHLLRRYLLLVPAVDVVPPPATAMEVYLAERPLTGALGSQYAQLHVLVVYKLPAVAAGGNHPDSQLRLSSAYPHYHYSSPST